MGDDDHGHSLRRKLLHQLQHLANHLRVERGGRLIKQHDLWVHRQRPHNRDPLLLASRKLVRIGIGFFRQSNPAQKLHRFLIRLRLCHQPQLNRCKGDVFAHAQMRK